jgi:type II secretory pathway component PulK
VKLFLAHIKKRIQEQRAIALLMVLASLAVISLIVGEVVFTVQLNQKIAYDRLDHLKAHALARSGLKLALLRIRAYGEIRKTAANIGKAAGATAAQTNAAMPRNLIEKIWNEPITIPFTGKIDQLPLAIRDALTEFRKDSGMEGSLYISIQSASQRFNLNGTTRALSRPIAKASPSPTPTPTSSTGNSSNTTQNTNSGNSANPSPTPVAYDPVKARESFTAQIQSILEAKMLTDSKFREKYRGLDPSLLADEMLAWADLTYQSPRERTAEVRFKKAPYYDVSELHFLPAMDDELFKLFAPTYDAGLSIGVNVNAMKDDVLKTLIPELTPEERQTFFAFRDAGPPANNNFASTDAFIKYLSEKVAYFAGSKSTMTSWKDGLKARGIELIVDEKYFVVSIEATVMQAKRIIEAHVVLEDGQSTAAPAQSAPGNVSGLSSVPRSNFRISRMRVY